MLSKACALAMIGSAAAFNAPMMSANTGRRQALAGAAAAGVVAPLLRSTPASAVAPKTKELKAPVVEIFDERDGCKGPSGASAGRAPLIYPNGGDAADDVMCIKVSMQPIKMKSQLAQDVAANYDNK